MALYDFSKHSGTLKPQNIYDENGLPIPQPVFEVNQEPAKTTDDALDQYKTIERYGAGFISTKGVAKVKPIGSTLKPTTFLFPRIQSVGDQNMLKIEYTPECEEVMELIEDKLLAMSKQNMKPQTVLMGKHQYRQFAACKSYNSGDLELPHMIADADIVIMDQEHYFDIIPSISNMITHKL